MMKNLTVVLGLLAISVLSNGLAEAQRPKMDAPEISGPTTTTKAPTIQREFVAAPGPCDCFAVFPAFCSTTILNTTEDLEVDVFVDWACLAPHSSSTWVAVRIFGPNGFDETMYVNNPDDGDFSFPASQTPDGMYDVVIEYAPFQFCFYEFIIDRQ